MFFLNPIRRAILAVTIAAAVLPTASVFAAEGATEPREALTQPRMELRLVGTVDPDGMFRKAPRRFARTAFDGSVLAQMKLTEVQVPTGLKLQSNEATVENFAPPVVARRAAPSKISAFAGLTTQVATLVYGRASVLERPLHIVSDSRGRVIVADPGSSCVHVLDGAESFRLVAGRGRRLQRPTGVAVGDGDKIFIADSEMAVVQVYGPEGQFLQTLGMLEDESIFERPSAIAFDRSSRRLFVVDTPVNEVVVLDQLGRVRQRAGGRRDPGRFVDPTEIAVSANTIAVLDDSASRVQVFDRDFNPVSSFRVRNVREPEDGVELGLAVDADGLIYVSSRGSSLVRVYSREGQLVYAHGGSMAGVKPAPSAVWVENSGRIYVSDSINRRIAVLELVRSDGGSR